MTNKERYKSAFSHIHASGDYCKGVLTMNKTKAGKFRIPKLAVVCLVVCLALGATGICYAANVGGIRQQIQVWIHGDPMDAEITFQGDGTYQLEFQDADGNTVSQGGGGVALDGSGEERPLTEEELMEELDSPDVQYEEDGRAILYYRNQTEDITDLFEDGVCYIKLLRDEGPLYVTVKYQNGLATSPEWYLSPEEFN